MSEFNKVLIANRGEIALRVMRTLKEMDIKSVAVYSEADRNSLHVRAADESVCIGPAPARESYLDISAIIAAAKQTGAQAIHPGYGFLSENAEFSKQVTNNGIVFIGPSPETISMLGYKSTAKALAVKNNVPVVPGSKGIVTDYKKEAKKIGFPIMIKASAGGGGKGMRLSRSMEDVEQAAKTASAEALAGFGDGSVYMERFVENPRHIEIQIAADSHGNVIAFPERDCSIQRRHQKLIEESPSPAVTPKIRKALAEAAARLVKASGYVGVGTVEFLMDKNGDFYFMEVNTRLQVEHPVTEMVSGVDLVREQIIIAQGGKVSINQTEALKVKCHAIEHRINAEDPNYNFAPCPGTVEEWVLPGGYGVRVDSHIYNGYTIPSYYDSMIAKLIVFGDSRGHALKRSYRALEEFHIKGVDTTKDFHKMLVTNPDFASGNFDTSFLEKLEKKNAENKQ